MVPHTEIPITDNKNISQDLKFKAIAIRKGIKKISIRIGINASSTDKLLIVYGDLVFNVYSIRDLTSDGPCAVVDSKDRFKEEEIGVTVVDGCITNFAYGLPKKWSQIAYFENESFDLIVSHLLTHETSSTALNNIISECMRLLKNKGLMVHVETDWGTEKSIVNRLNLDWETHYNAEPFKTSHDQIDKYKLAQKYGFKKKNILLTKVDSHSKNKYYNGRWNLFTAIKET